MASKHSALLDLQDENAEINLQFQDFGTAETDGSREEAPKGQAIYFDSFPDSLDDDQSQKLLDEDGDESPSKPVYSFWTFEYYQQFFDVESKQVGDRILWSMVPKPGVNFLQSYIRPNPDLYGPFWICVTLVFTTAIAGNLSNYLQSTQTEHWRYEFHKVTLATSSIFSYAWLVPLVIWGILFWQGSKANISLLEMICLYGYSLAIFVPVSLLWMIPLRWLQWCLGIVASVLSGSVLVCTIQPAVSREAKKVAVGLAVLILVLHFALALGFMLYFFYPSSYVVSASEVAAPMNQSNIQGPPTISRKEKDSAKIEARSEPLNVEIPIFAKEKVDKPSGKEKGFEVAKKREESSIQKEISITNKTEVNTFPEAQPLKTGEDKKPDEEISNENTSEKKPSTALLSEDTKNAILQKIKATTLPANGSVMSVMNPIGTVRLDT